MTRLCGRRVSLTFRSAQGPPLRGHPFPVSPFHRRRAPPAGITSRREYDNPIEALRLARHIRVRNLHQGAGPRHVVRYWRPGCRAQGLRALNQVGLANLAGEADHKRIAASETAPQREWGSATDSGGKRPDWPGRDVSPGYLIHAPVEPAA